MGKIGEQVAAKDARFAFGRNWSHYLAYVDEERIRAAEASLREMLGSNIGEGATFLDAGSGSGIMSLAARRLGAVVHAFDYDVESVDAAQRLRDKYRPGDTSWVNELGSVLDLEYMESLGRWDIVYSWGVLHHTGHMWKAMDNIAASVKTGGRLFIAIYNDQGLRSTAWSGVKRLYSGGPAVVRPIIIIGTALIVFMPPLVRRGLSCLLKLGGHGKDREGSSKPRSRSLAMSRWHDLVDWAGGFPFEVATPDEVVNYYAARGFTLERLRTKGGGSGCNEYVFLRLPERL